MPRLAARVARAVRIAVLPVAAAAVVSACGSTQPPARPLATASIPRALLSEARPIGTGPRFALPASGPVAVECQPSLGCRQAYARRLVPLMGEPLSRTRLTSFSAPAGTQVAVYVDGRRWNGGPGSVPLARHAEIVLEVGPRVPPHSSYAFPPGT